MIKDVVIEGKKYQIEIKETTAFGGWGNKIRVYAAKYNSMMFTGDTADEACSRVIEYIRGAFHRK